MELFGIKFREYIECQGYSVRQFAKDANFDRSWLTNILNNKKKLPETAFSQLVNNNYFSDEQINKLKYIYYSATFTETEFEHIEYIIKKFASPIILKKYIPENIPDKNTSAVIGFNNVLCMLYGLFYSEKKYYYVYSNIPASMEEHLSIIYYFLKQRGTGDYKHILYLDHGVSTNNLNSYFMLIYFAGIGYKMSILKNVNTTQIETLSNFPYYVMVNNKMIMFDSRFESAIYIDNDVEINLYQKGFSKIYDNTEQILSYYDNPADYNNARHHYNKVTLNHKIISNDYNLALLLTDDIYKSNINHSFPNTNYLISALKSYYNVSESNRNTHYITVNALSHFVKNGRIAQFPESYFDSLSVRQRIDMLNIQKKAAAQKKYNIKLINPTRLRYSSYTFDSDCENMLNVSGFCDSEVNSDSFLGNFSVLIKDKSVLRDFSNTFDFINKNNYIYSDEYYMNYIDGCIKELESRLLY
ncbi:MAG: hypothetical protein HFH14_11000 [Lachnospiraceae bacterium]|nr:hypothetical protein [Lachnospiraceae bacterium]